MLFGKKRTIEELKKKLGKTEAELKASQDLLKDTNDRFNDARRHSTAVKTDLQDSIEEKDKTIAALKSRLSTTEEDLKKAVMEKESALNELTAAKAEIGSLESRIEAAAKEKTELLSKLSSKASTAEVLEEKDEGYDVKFIVDGKEIAKVRMDSEADSGKIPEVPFKKHYIGEWQYERSGKDVTVNAVYTPIVYDLVFFVDDAKYAEKKATADQFSDLPPVPAREDYEGEWRYTVIDGSSARIDAVYTPVEYKIRYLADGEVIAKTTASAESDVIIPEVPEKEGYKGEWQYSVCGDAVDVEAVYRPAYYDLVFFVDDAKYAEKRVDSDEDFELPAVPEKEDCVGEWAYTVIDGSSARIDAVYTPVTYLLRFFVDGELIAERAASPGADVDIPDVPVKEGYKGEWQYEDLGDHVAAVEAVYRPAYYDLVFFVDDVKYAEK
ncbi:MAG: InlB B-repeat-containing protein, partial [Candidatus Methanomethylophilaceae archaeon]|nr:InlB B-repeat-containing protein [Candidatus Methanomethylophilaceae archaeon]